MAMEHQDRNPASEGDNCHSKQEAVITHDRIPQPGEMTQDGSQHRAGGQNASHPSEPWDQEAN